MPAPPIPIDDLLQPIAGDNPAGEDFTYLPEWPVLKEAKREEESGSQGAWERERKVADWPQVEEMALEGLAKSKHLMLGVFLAEARITRYGFDGLKDSLLLLKRLIEEFWDKGLYPGLEDGSAEYRAKPLDWLGEKMAQAIMNVPLTVRKDSGENFSYNRYQASRKVGYDKDIRNQNGDIDERKKEIRDQQIAAGQPSGEMWDAAVQATNRPKFEEFVKLFDETWDAFKQLDDVIGEKFQNESPSTSESRDAFENCRNLINTVLRLTKPAEAPGGGAEAGGTVAGTAGATTASVGGHVVYVSEDGGSGGSWKQAEDWIAQGDIQRGLSEMTRLAAAEHGRGKFLRRLRLAEICISMSRERLGLQILEELAKQIDDIKLEQWESPELIGRVWGRLYRGYRNNEERAERARELFDKLCRLDPWQALRWEE